MAGIDQCFFHALGQRPRMAVVYHAFVRLIATLAEHAARAILVGDDGHVETLGFDD